VIGTIARKSLCPSRFCGASNPMQTLVAKIDAERTGEPALENATWCSSCGCVWVRDPRGLSRPLGILRKQGTTYRWTSAWHSPSPRDKKAGI
jgi:hypothetical protein